MSFKNTILAAAFAALPLAGNAAVVDAFDILANNPNCIQSNISFELGTEYTIEVSGQFIIDQGRFADAEYFDIQTANPRDTSGGFDIGVQINETDIDWGPYAADNVYTYTTSDLSGIINMRLAEASVGAYSDNGGILRVQVSTEPAPVSPVPLPAGMPLLLAGLGGFALMRRRQS